MDFSRFVANILSSAVILLKRIVSLAWYPYKTMRSISEDTDIMQVILIWSGVLLYFLWANRLRQYEYEPFILYLMTVFHVASTVFFFFFFAAVVHKKEVTVRSFILTFSYSLIPTLMWFTVNSFLYALLPPPRTISLLGKAFSILYISFSVGMLLWKIILQYLAIRFSTKLDFYRIMFGFLFYLVMMIPYSLFLYSVKFFRIPFL